MTARPTAPAIGCAAVALALSLTACGEKEERVGGASGADVRALVGAGLAAAGADTHRAALTFRTEGPVLRVRLAAPPSGGALTGLLSAVRGLRVEVEPFCPKPALLRCRPSLRAWVAPRSREAVNAAVTALRSLAAQTYAQPPLVRRRGAVTRIVTANGELLAAVAPAGATVGLSFGGLSAPRRSADVPPGGLEVEAKAEALAAMRRDLPPAARRALAGVRRLIVTAPLPSA